MRDMPIRGKKPIAASGNNSKENTMTLSIDSQLTLKDLDTYIKVQMDDPRYEDIDMDPVLDLILHAHRRLDKGDYMPRVVSEAMVSLDEYLLAIANCEACAI